LKNGICYYYATFIPGLQELIAEVVRERLGDVIIRRLLDGAVLFETSIAYDRFNFLCFNNIFAVASIMEHTDRQGGTPLEAHINAILRNGLSAAAGQVIAHNSKKFHTFRVVISLENTPAAINEKLRHGAEQYIARLSGLKPDRARPDAEFWFLYRHEPESPFSVFMKRLTMRPSWEKTLHPGELPPPLAWMLCRVGELKHSDTVLDPFCGYGSIPRAAKKYFHITQCIACDINEKSAADIKADFRTLTDTLPGKSVDAVITDPPWGHYREIPVTQLYEDMFRVFTILLKNEGRAVILCDRTDTLINAARNRFTVIRNIPILLSGKKAAIYQFVKTVPA